MSIEAIALILAWLMLIVLALAMSRLMVDVRVLQALLRGANVRATGSQLRVALRELGEHDLRGRTTHILLVEGTCSSCRAIMPAYRDLSTRQRGVTWLVAALDDGAWLTDWPGWPDSVVADQHALKDRLGIRIAPFGLVVEDGWVTRSQALGSKSVLRQFFVRRSDSEIQPGVRDVAV